MEKISNHGFSDDLVLEILNKLPVESLCKLKSVSKSWLSLIQTPTFSDKVLPKTQLKLEITEDRDEANLYVYSIDENGIPTYLNKLDQYTRNFKHCNGLIFSYNGSNRINVLNLTTQESMRLSLADHAYNYWGVGCVGFGFDPSSKKYKVLSLGFGGYGSPSEVRVLTLDNYSFWKPAKDVPLRGLWLLSAITVNGDLFWIDDFQKGRIISFNFVHEKFVRIDLPRKLNKKEYGYTLFDYDGNLCLVESARSCLQIVNCWMLKNIEDNLWIRLLKNVTLLTGDGINLAVRPSFFSARSGEISIVACGDKELDIFTFSLLSREFTKIKVLGLLFKPLCVANHIENCRSLEEEFYDIFVTFIMLFI